ncbi:hypothetical protein BT93_H1621 [Corymbia citriodora subsp. variegata]|nr:hypothetical protein BT93_H1621 [Corymbia citriodora subsp. variegata]
MAHSASVSIFFAGRSSFWLESPRLSGVRERSPGGKSLPRSITSRGIDRLLSSATVQKQHHKSNAKKRPHLKKQGKQADNTQFRAQLDAPGLKIVQVTADGNCFFRALADQLEGNEDVHGKYRTMVVQYILVCGVQISLFKAVGRIFLHGDIVLNCISAQQSESELLFEHVTSVVQPGARMIHLSYHDEEHYNSVRLKEDTGDRPSRPITIKADSNLSSSPHQAKAGSNKSKSGTVKDITDAGSIKLLMAGSGRENIEKVEQTLLPMHGDVDAAIEYLIAEQCIEEFLEETVQSSCNADASHGNGW